MPAPTDEQLDRIEEQVRGRAFLYEEPSSFEAGIRATIEALRMAAARRRAAS